MAGSTSLLVAIRRHGQFAEYVPISIILLLLLEIGRANRIAPLGLAAMLMISRLSMAVGLGRIAHGEEFAAVGNDRGVLDLRIVRGAPGALIFASARVRICMP
jgi:hypothetical protein